MFENKINFNKSPSFFENSSISNTKFFVINNFIESDKICNICGSSFTNKFNKERHIRDIHEKKKDIENNKSYAMIFGNIDLEDEQNFESSVCQYADNKREANDKNVIKKNFSIAEENNNKFKVNPACQKNLKDDPTPHHENEEQLKNEQNKSEQLFWLIQSNKYRFYEIFQKYEHIPLKNYFLFKNLIIGQGKYGTVWFGIDVNKSHLVAIKSENKSENRGTIEFEIDVMNELNSAKIFSKFYDKIEIVDRIFLVETLQGPTIANLWNFCGRKFSVKTIYKIGIELIYCLKLFHAAGFIYLDLKGDNITILLNQIKIKEYEMNLTLIDFGFAERYMTKNGIHYRKDNSAKVHGNSYLSSINALSNKPVSRKDDIISLCYFLVDLYLGSLPWSDLGNDKNSIKKIIEYKNIFTPKILCGKGLERVVSIYEKANNLDFYDTPDYDEYINILSNKCTDKAKNRAQKFLFDWEIKFNKLIRENKNLESLVKCNCLINELFAGYPESIVADFLQNYKK